MSQPNNEQLQKDALEQARTILLRRLKKAGISTSRPDLYLQCEAGTPPVSFGTGYEVRVNVWRHWSDARVIQDATPPADPKAAQGKPAPVIGWAVDRRSDPPTEKKLDADQALALINDKVTLPAGAKFVGVRAIDYAPQRTMTQLEWAHELPDGTRVLNDFVRVIVHPVTGVLISFDRRWTDVSV